MPCEIIVYIILQDVSVYLEYMVSTFPYTKYQLFIHPYHGFVKVVKQYNFFEVSSRSNSAFQGSFLRDSAVWSARGPSGLPAHGWACTIGECHHVCTSRPWLLQKLTYAELQSRKASSSVVQLHAIVRRARLENQDILSLDPKLTSCWVCGLRRQCVLQRSDIQYPDLKTW